MQLDPIVVISILGALVLLVLLMGTPLKPVKMIGQVFIKIIIGALFLFFLNTLGNQFGIHVPINLITSAISGVLGIPGLCALVAINMWVL